MKKVTASLAAILFLCGCDSYEEHAFDKSIIDTQSQALSNSDVYISPEVSDCMKYAGSCSDKLDISAVFDDSPDSVFHEDLSFEVIEGVKFLNNKRISEREEKEFYEKMAGKRKNVLREIIAKRKLIADEIIDLGIDLDVDRVQEYINGNDALHVQLSVNDILKLSNSKHILGIELYDPPHDTNLQTAMLATYVTQSRLFQYNLG